MIKPLLINSYPRSGSGFLGQLLIRLPMPGIEVSVIHSPSLIGIKEAITVTILRDPVEAISSNIFKSSRVNDISEIMNRINTHVSGEVNYYCTYVKVAENTSSYLMDFNKLKDDPVGEVNKFLKYHQIDMLFFVDKDSIFETMWKEKYHSELDDIHGGHIPRGVETHPDYIKIYEYVSKSEKLKEAKELYRATIEKIL